MPSGAEIRRSVVKVSSQSGESRGVFRGSSSSKSSQPRADDFGLSYFAFVIHSLVGRSRLAKIREECPESSGAGPMDFIAMTKGDACVVALFCPGVYKTGLL